MLLANVVEGVTGEKVQVVTPLSVEELKAKLMVTWPVRTDGHLLPQLALFSELARLPVLNIH